jgi:uncharacterized caspase-like protein
VRLFFVLIITLLLSHSLFAAEDRSLVIRKKTGASERRVALIIGNSTYSDAPLKNPVNDADSMARVLRETDFDVTVIKNADRRKMYSSMNEFGRKLKKSDIGLFYYAGHGVQIDNSNYLLPTDLKGSDIQETDDLRHNAFPLNELMDRMRDASTNNIIILDACRDNPFLAKISRSASRGLAKVSTPASTSILYSTDPGNTASDGVSGDNGVFTNRLVESIQKSGLELVEVMREVALNVTRDTNGAQRPVFDGVLSNKFYFREPEAIKPAEPPQSITVDRQVMDLRYWESTEKSGTSAAYQSYLKKFPAGDFAELAKDRLEQIAAQKAHDNTKIERDRLAKEKAELERAAKEAAERDRIEREKATLERTVRENAERDRLAKERSDLEQRIREAEAKAIEAENRSKQSESRLAAEQARVAAEHKATLERLQAQSVAKPEVVASLQSDKVAKKEVIKEKINNFTVSDLTVTDEKSGLIWVRDTKATGRKNYSNAQSVVNRMNKNMSAGYDDWRLPGDSDYNILYKSLKSEAEKRKTTVLQIIDKLFLNYPDLDPWVFTQFFGNPNRLLGSNSAITFDFRDGTLRETKINDEALVLLVRGSIQTEERLSAEQARLAIEQKTNLERANSQLAAKPQVVASLQPDKVAKREVIKEKISNFMVSELIVTDETSGLVWVRDTKVTGIKSYSNAHSVINKLNMAKFAGYDDWRMPRDSDYFVFYDNLKTEAKKSNSTVLQIIDRLFANYPDSDPWVYTFFQGASRKQKDGAFTYDFRDGTMREMYRNDDGLVLLVRGTIK